MRDPSQPNANNRHTGLFAPHGRGSAFAIAVACPKSTLLPSPSCLPPDGGPSTKADNAPLDNSAFQSLTANSSRAAISSAPSAAYIASRLDA